MAFSFGKLLVTLVPNGTYKAEVSKMEFTQSKTNAEQYNCKVTLVIKEGTYAKRTILDTISTAYISKFKSILTAVGVDLNKEYATMDEMYKAGAKQAVGKEIMIKVSSKTYNGNDYNQVDDYSPIPGSTTSAAEVLKDFNLDETPNLKPEIKDVKVEEKPVAEASDTIEAPSIDIDLDILK